jgi:hypothetical protein
MLYCLPVTSGVVHMVVARLARGALEKPFEKSGEAAWISIPLQDMSSTIQAPVSIHYPARNASVVSRGAELLHSDTFFPDHGIFLEEENARTRKRVECVAQYKLPTYQAAAVVVGVVLP